MHALYRTFRLVAQASTSSVGNSETILWFIKTKRAEFLMQEAFSLDSSALHGVAFEHCGRRGERHRSTTEIQA